MSNGSHSEDPKPRADRRTFDIVNAGLKRRYRAERRFRWYGLISIVLALTFLALLFFSIISKGYTAFQQTYIQLDIHFDPAAITPDGQRDPQALKRGNYRGLVKQALRAGFPAVSGRTELRKLRSLISGAAARSLRQQVLDNPALIGKRRSVWVLADDEVDQYMKGDIDASLPESDRVLSDQKIAWIEQLAAQGRIDKRFNTLFFTHSDSREPEQAGIYGALLGSFYTLLVTLLLSFPIGVGAAVYLEEFAPKNRWTDWVEININNLAAVPSIVYGLLGLAVFINVFGLPRSAPLVGGLALTLMTLPTIIIASRAAIRSVPPSIREAALGIGASRMQMVTYHVLPLAMPGMLTGTIIGMAQALGETAPLLLIGMVAFIVAAPSGPLDPSTVLPVQVFLWFDSPERAFVERTSAAIMVLLAFLIAMNALAVFLRKRFEKRW